jgi:hypothetical protein
MELDATHQGRMPDNIRQKHMTDCTCFNCRKLGYIARNCKGSRNQRGKGQGGRIQLAAIDRGGYDTTGTKRSYNRLMQMFATLYKEPSSKTLEGAGILSDIARGRPA